MPASTAGKTGDAIVIPVSIFQLSLILLFTLQNPLCKATVAGNSPPQHAPASLPAS